MSFCWGSKMKKKLKKVIIPILLLSFALNLFLIYHYYDEEKKEKEELGFVVNNLIFNMNESVNHLNDLDMSHPDYKNRLILVYRNFAENEGFINAHIKEMPQNLVSWNGEMVVGLGNGIYEVDEEGTEETVEDILNFSNGYHNEIQHLNPEEHPYEALQVIETVLSNQKYMGERFIYQ